MAHRRIPAQSGLIVAAAGAATYSCRPTQQSHAGIGRPPCFTNWPRFPPNLMTLDTFVSRVGNLGGPTLRENVSHARLGHEISNWRTVRSRILAYSRESGPLRASVSPGSACPGPLLASICNLAVRHAGQETCEHPSGKRHCRRRGLNRPRFGRAITAHSQ